MGKTNKESNEEEKEEIKHFTDLDAWKVNHELALKVYKVTKDFPKEERFGLTDQLRRAANSVTANIVHPVRDY